MIFVLKIRNVLVIFPEFLNVETFLTSIVHFAISDTNFQAYKIYMASWELVNVDPIDRDEIGEEDDKWGDDLMNDLRNRLDELRRFNATLETSSDKDKLKKGTIKLVANETYDKITNLFNNTRKRSGIKGGSNIWEPIRNYDSFDPDDNGNLTFVHLNEVIGLGIINEGLDSPSKMIKKLGVNRLTLMGFRNITNEDIHFYRSRYKDGREKVRKLNDNLNERSKAIESSSTTDAEAIELMEIMSEDIDMTIKGVEREMPFIEAGERDKLLPLRELQRLDKQLRTVRGSLKVAIAKRIDLENRIKHEENELNEIQDPTYSDDHRKMIED